MLERVPVPTGLREALWMCCSAIGSLGLAYGMDATSVARTGSLAPPPAHTAQLVHAEDPVSGVPPIRTGSNVGNQLNSAVGRADQSLLLVASALRSAGVVAASAVGSANPGSCSDDYALGHVMLKIERKTPI